jgi:tetratricopeptide (TPR) repeat protein
VAEQVILYTLNPGDGDFKSILPDSTDTETSSFSGYSYPGFLIYAADGQLLEPSSPQPPNEIKTIEDWLEWIKEVKAGNSYFGLKQQVKSAPENRELLGQWIEKIPLFYEKERTEALKKFIDLNPDTNDPRTQESYEDLIWDLSLYIRAEADFDKNEIRRLAEENQPYFDALMKAYFPDRFAYTLKESRNQLTIVSFLNDLGRYGEACSCFEKLLNQANSRSREVLDDFNFSEVLWAYLKSGQEEKAESWLDRLEKSVAQAKTTEEKEQMGFLLSTFYEPFIRFYGEKGERGRARDYLQKVIELNKHNNREMENEDLKIRYAWEFGLFAEELIAKAKEELKTADGRAIWDLTGNIAEWTAALGDKPEARRIIGEALTDRRILDAYAEKGKRTLLMKAAQTLTLSKAADEQTLEYAQEAVRLKEDTNSLMILADVYAALGRFDEAIQCGGKIINSSPDRRLSAFIQKKIERWKRERSSGINKN